MNENTVTVMGNVVNEPELHVTKAGQTFVTFRLASTARRQNAQTRRWEPVSTNFYSVSAWRALAGNVHTSIKKGQPIIVHGRLRVNDFTRKDESKGTRVEIDALTIGHDLSLGSAEWVRGAVAISTGSDRHEDEQVQRAFDADEGYAMCDPVTGEVTEQHDLRTEREGDVAEADTDGHSESDEQSPAAEAGSGHAFALAQ